MKKLKCVHIALACSVISIAIAHFNFPRCTGNYSGNGTFFGDPDTIVLVIAASIFLTGAALLADLIIARRQKYSKIALIALAIPIPVLLFVPAFTVREALRYIQEEGGLFNTADYCRGG